jgi:hypothetical protein
MYDFRVCQVAVELKMLSVRQITRYISLKRDLRQRGFVAVFLSNVTKDNMPGDLELWRKSVSLVRGV